MLLAASSSVEIISFLLRACLGERSEEMRSSVDVRRSLIQRRRADVAAISARALLASRYDTNFWPVASRPQRPL